MANATQLATCIWDAKAELGEGAFWHEQEQAFYWVDIIRSQLHRYRQSSDGESQKESWDFPGSLSSVIACSEGGLLATFANGVAHIDVDTGEVTELHNIESELANNRFNDGCADTRGNYWFGSMDNLQSNNSGNFYRLRATGEITQITQFNDICITNGPTFSADGLWGYFTDTVAGKIFRVGVCDTGINGDPELHIEFGEGDGHPDGMCTDSEGFLWVCHWGGARVTRFNPAGEVDRVVSLPVPNVTKCAFGGPDLKTLYITTAATGLSEQEKTHAPLAGGVFTIELEQQGFVFPAVSTQRSQ
jgi:xylono-1,5-lactonase